MDTTPSPQDIIAEITAAARRVGITSRVARDVAALAIINADQTVSLGEARRIVAKLLPSPSA